MDFRGKIIAVMPLQKGISKANGNEWKKQEYVIENHDQYPRKMCFNLWSDKIDQFNIQLGEELNVSFDIDAREYNGRWYNDIRAWKVERVTDAAQQQPVQAPAISADDIPPMHPVGQQQAESDDDLPF